MSKKKKAAKKKATPKPAASKKASKKGVMPPGLAAYLEKKKASSQSLRSDAPTKKPVQKQKSGKARPSTLPVVSHGRILW